MKKLCALFLTLALVLGLLPCAAFAAEDAPLPFTALSADETLTVSKSEADYTYTVVTEYDENWNPVATEERSAALYVVAVPADAESVTLDFGSDTRIAYCYTAEGGYVGSCGDYGDGTVGQTTASVSDLSTYVRVQTPYDESWNSEFLYAVAFDAAQPAPDTPDQTAVSMEALLTNISAGYTDASGEWIILDMAAYEDTTPDAQFKTSEAAKQTYIDAAITSVTTEGAGETAYAKAILALQSIGVDPEQLYPEGSDAPISAVAGLTALESHGSSAWVAPYTLAALNQGDYGTQALVQSILSAVLSNQNEDGSWSEWGDSIQTTANLLAGLAFYYGEEEAVTAAVDSAVAYLSAVQKEDGSFDAYGSGADSNTAAMVVTALSALGIDPDADTRFVKNGVSALDALLSFALADNSGFGYMNNTSINGYSTEQGFRALVAASQVMETGEAYNVYDFSANEVAPAYAGGKPESGDGEDVSPSVDEITVFFELKTHKTTWIDEHAVTVDEDATVADVFYQVLDSREEFSYVDDGGYISSITYGDTTWAEFDAGKNSGWKYTVNGVAPSAGMEDMSLEDGDEIVWYYVTDYTKDTHRDEDAFSAPAVPEPPFADVDGHWAHDAIAYCYDAGLMSGVSKAVFAPDTALSRAMVVTILYAMEDKPEIKSAAIFADVPTDTWYTDAVLWAAENGIVSGYGDDAFGPGDNVTREQLAAILLKYSQYKDYDADASESLIAFADADEVSSWALPGLEWAVAEGLLSGRSDDTLAPKAEATRGEMAAILSSFLENIAE